jgi:hypothetical protein
MGRQLRDDFTDIVDEAHIEHSIGFVENPAVLALHAPTIGENALFANTSRAETIARARELLGRAAANNPKTDDCAPQNPEPSNAHQDKCPCCGGRMVIIETFERGARPRYRSSPPVTIRIDTS